jgi:hypothetical protein
VQIGLDRPKLTLIPGISALVRRILQCMQVKATRSRQIPGAHPKSIAVDLTPSPSTKVTPPALAAKQSAAVSTKASLARKNNQTTPDLHHGDLEGPASAAEFSTLAVGSGTKPPQRKRLGRVPTSSPRDNGVRNLAAMHSTVPRVNHHISNHEKSGSGAMEEDGKQTASLHPVEEPSDRRTATKRGRKTASGGKVERVSAVGKPQQIIAPRFPKKRSAAEEPEQCQKLAETPQPCNTSRHSKTKAQEFAKALESSQLDILAVTRASQVKISPIEDASPFDDLPHSSDELGSSPPRGRTKASQGTQNKRQLHHPVVPAPAKKPKPCNVNRNMQMAVCSAANKDEVPGKDKRPTTRSVSNKKQEIKDDGGKGGLGNTVDSPPVWASQEESPPLSVGPHTVNQGDGACERQLPATSAPVPVAQACNPCLQPEVQHNHTCQSVGANQVPYNSKSPSTDKNPVCAFHELSMTTSDALQPFAQVAGNQSAAQPSDEVLLAAGRMLHQMMMGGAGPNNSAAFSGYAPVML